MLVFGLISLGPGTRNLDLGLEQLSLDNVKQTTQANPLSCSQVSESACHEV